MSAPVRPRFRHQEEEARHARAEARALWWSVGAGKTRSALEHIRALIEDGSIDRALVLMPPVPDHMGTWDRDEAPRWLPGVQTWRYRSAPARTPRGERAAARAIASREPILATMTYPSLITARGKRFAEDFLRAGRAMLVLDESHTIGNTRAMTSRAAMRLGPLAAYRRVLSGTPSTETPFWIWAQIRFLDPTYWQQHGMPTPQLFERRYGLWRTLHLGPRAVQICQGYRRLDELQAHMCNFGQIVRTEDCLDLPDRILLRRSFRLDPEQERVYRELARNAIAELSNKDSSTAVESLRIRLQQAACGWSVGDETGLAPLGSRVRVAALRDALDELAGQRVMIWGAFRADVEEIAVALGDSCVAVHGGCSPDARRAAFDAIRAGTARHLVATQHTASEGITLTELSAQIFYSQGWSLRQRIQCEGRTRRPGQTRPCVYVDLVAENTIDEDILSALLRKQDLSLMHPREVLLEALKRHQERGK